jgi:hypothetical protein
VTFTAQAPRLLKGFIYIEGEADKALPTGLSLAIDSDLLVGYAVTSPRTDGSFEFENVPSGQYQVLLRGEASRRYYVKRLRYGTSESSENEVSISADGNALEVVLSSDGASVSGMIRRNGPAGSATPQVVLMPYTSDAGLRHYDTHLGALDQSGEFVVKEPVRPGEYTLYAFEGVPDGAWTDAEFIKEVGGKGVRIKLGSAEAKTVDVPLIPRAEIAPLLTRLGMD